tara:strand:+ start:618 stop:875 length:258 start_codon:yes stop_codon:yes gene_type:complete
LKKISDSKLLGELNNIFIEVFDDESIEINSKTTSSDISNWDSLNHIRLILEIESKYQIKFNLAEIEDLKNVGEFLELLRKKLNGD